MMMENESSSGFGSDSSDRVTRSRTRTADHENINGGGLGDAGFFLKLQRTESFPCKLMTNQNRSNEGFSRGCGVGGPTCCDGGSRLASDIYDAPGVGDSGGGGARTLQAFNSSAFNYPGAGMAATTLKFPFTSAQYQELERQALIYKYMMNCAPIPLDLLLPISRSLPETTTSHSYLVGRSSSCFNLRFSNNRDPEPGRCRRTDGKKWRCSRDVAPDQKYCERHMHRGRPRSRKHVEVQTEINNKINLSVPPMAITTNNTNKSYNLPSEFSSKPDFKVPPFESMAYSAASSYKDNTSCIEWMMERGTVPMASAPDQQWKQLMNSKAALRTNSNISYTSSPVFQQQYQETLNLNSYRDFGGAEGSETQQRNDQFGLFPNHELTSLDDNMNSDQRQTPRGFIDAWSTASDNSKPTETTNYKSSVFASNKFSPSNLSLSMSGCNSTEEEINQIEMGLGIKSQTLSWMAPVSWMTTSQPGGPLAEVLQSSTTTSKSSIDGGGGLNLMKDGNWFGNGENSSPRLTTISSPSGVLQKTLASLSDSSGSSSPNSLSDAAKSKIALQLLNQSKLH